MDIRPASSTLPDLARRRASYRSARTGDGSKAANQVSRRSRPVDLQPDMVGSVNASRIAALHGMTAPQPHDRASRMDAAASDAYRRSRSAVSTDVPVTALRRLR